MRHVLSLSLIAPVLTAAPCLGSQPAASQPSSAPVVTVIEAGASPRQALRLAPSVGARHPFDLTMHVSTTQSVGQDVLAPEIAPAITFSIEALVTGIDETRNITYEYECTDIIVHDAPDVPPPLLERMRQDMRSIIGLRGRGVLSARAVSRHAEVMPPAGMNPMLRGQTEGLQEMLKQTMIPFPVEPVGVGASWQVATAIHEGGVTIDQTIVYTLASTNGRMLELTVQLTQAADPQEVTAPSLPPTATARLALFTSEGRGRAVIRLDEVLPASSTREIINDTSVVYRMGDLEQEVRQHMEMKTELKTPKVGSGDVGP